MDRLARIACLSQTVEVFFALYGWQESLAMAKSRSGKWFDPNLVDALQSIGQDLAFWKSVTEPNVRENVRRWEPPDEQRVADQETIDNVAKAFARVVDAKSPWTHKHSEGVANIASGIARELGLSSEMQHDLWRGGFLHDVGKLGVSNMILDKPGRPTDEEFAAIRKHPDYSHQILGQIECFKDFSEIAASHHERLDGRGYFRGITGEDLPSPARILAVADVYEALTAKRPYRDDIPHEKVIEIMRKDLGTALCPETFEALLRWLDKTAITPRVEAQLEEIERLTREVSQ